MSTTLRLLLIIASVLSFVLCIKKVQKAKLKMSDSVVWMIGSIILIIMSIFPRGIEWISERIGFIAPVNFVFFMIIVFLLIEVYYLDLQLSGQNEKIKNLNHYIAIKENKENKENK